MSKQPLVTVIALCYNHQKFVEECLESIRTQSYENIEFIITDDRSSDASAQLIEAFIARHSLDCHFIKHEENRGVCKTLNEALSLAKGKFISFTSTDDVWMKDKIKVMVEEMEKLPEDVGVIYSDAHRIDQNGGKLPSVPFHDSRKFPPFPEGEIFDYFIHFHGIIIPATLIRKQCFEEVGLCDERLAFEDRDLMIRISYRFKVAFSPQIQTKYRQNVDSLGHELRKKENPSGPLSDILMVEKYLTTMDLTRQQKAFLKGVLASSALALFRQGHVDRIKYLKSTFSYTLNTKVIVCLSLYYLLPQKIGMQIFLFMRSVKQRLKQVSLRIYP